MRNAWGRKVLVCLGVLGLVTGLLVSTAAGQSNHVYKHLVVQPFEVPPGIDLPASFADGLRRNIVRHLEDTKRFEKLTVLDTGQPVPADADIVLTGTITSFNAGNRAERYLVGFGAGKTSIRATVKFTDPVVNHALLEQEVHGVVVIGLFGGDSMGATNGLAKGLAKAVKKELP